MVLPVNVNTITVTGTYMDMSGTPLVGTVTFRPAADILRNPDANVLITDFPFEVTLDVNGSFSVALPATDDPDLVPSPWHYVVSENMNDHRRQWLLEVPLSSPGGTLDLADVDRAVRVPAVITYASRTEFLAHATDTTGVHGIADTANLETKSGAQNKADAAQSAATAAAASSAATLYARKDRLVYNLKDFAGVVGDGVANDSAAIQAAIDFIPDGGTLFVPRGSYLVGPSSVGTDANAIFTRANGQRINIIGEGFGSIFSVHASTPNTMDVFKFNWTTSARGMRFEDFTVQGAAGSNPGRHAIMFNLTSGTTVLLYQIIFRNLALILDNATGKGLCVDVNPGSASGGMAYSTIEECLIDGIRWVNVGDNNKISHNTLIPTGSTTPTIYASNIGGAKNLVICHNVIAGLSTMIQYDGGYSPVIDGNWFETPGTILGTYPNAAMVDINGATIDARHVKIINNSFMSHFGTGLPNPIRLNKSFQAFVEGNYLYTWGTATKSIVITATSEDNIIGANTYEQGVAGWPANGDRFQEVAIQDLGTRTVFLTEWKSNWTPSIFFGGGATGISYGTRTGVAIKVGRIVHFDMLMPLGSKGTSTGAMVIGTLPWAAARNTPVSVEITGMAATVGDTNISAFVVGTSGLIQIYKMVAGTNTILTDADFTNTSQVRIAGSYLTV